MGEQGTMEKDYKAFTWSDNWQIEGDKAWFVSGMHNILICLDLNTKECASAVSIPEEALSKCRLTPYCMKCGDDIFCMPDTGKSIWIYNLKENGFSEIVLQNPEKVRLTIYDFWMHDNKLFAVSNGLGRIIEIDIKNRKLETSYMLCEDGIRKSIKVGTDIYSLLKDKAEICQFDLIKKTVTTYKLPDTGRKYSTFCFDGEKFWLSGYGKEIYIWKKNENTLKTITGFPKDFGIYNFSKETNGEIDCVKKEYELPAFLFSVAAGDYVWFIPFQTNKIMYADKKTYQLHAFEVDGENETKQSLLGRIALGSKYILEYVREDRYIGLFSIKNNYILEIDAIGQKKEIKKYTFSDKCIREMKEIFSESTLSESDGVHREIFKSILLGQNGKGREKPESNNGLKLYKEMLKL